MRVKKKSVGGGGIGKKEVTCRAEDQQVLAAQEDHISWSFPFKPPLVNASVGVCFAPQLVLRLDEYAC